MEFGSVVQFLENRNILVTGATGFLAKIFVEKVLRVQPNVKKIYLLVRAADANSASQRLQSEVLGKDLFRVLKGNWGSDFNSFIREKIVSAPGDISIDEELGLNDINLREEMFSQLDVIVNLAAITKFDERYDIALATNTLGAKHVICFAKKCVKLEILLHVSTAFVCGEKSGLILETPYTFEDTLNGVVQQLDIDEERSIVERTLNKLEADGATDQQVKEAMQHLGMERANFYGWPNTYVFTKAMGEMIVGNSKKNLSVVIIRPSIVSSTLKEPIPGWIEGFRTIDSFIVSYAKGRLKHLVGDINGVLDVLPADMVVNAMLVAAVAHANRPSEAIYQVCSSSRNLLKCEGIRDYSFTYFRNKPWIDRKGKPVKVGRVKTLSFSTFRRYMVLRYLLLPQALEFVNLASCKCVKGIHSDYKRTFNFMMKLMELHRPYLFSQGIFDDTNTEKLRMAARENGTETHWFYFDPMMIDWEDYFLKVHIPGVMKYICK